MATPLEVINSRRQPVVYRAAPTASRRAPARRAPAPPPHRGAASISPGQVDWGALKEKALNTTSARKKAEKEAQEAAPEQEGFWGSDFGKGLGFLIGNPVTRAVLTPLNYLQTLGRGTTLGVEAAAEGLEGAPSWLQGAVGAIPGVGNLIGAVDTTRTEADTRSNVSKVFAPNTTYGYGELLYNPPEDAPKWQKALGGAAGFAGDVALDPLTYVTGGSTRAVNAASQVNRASRGLDDAAELFRLANEAGDASRITDATRTLDTAADYANRAPDLPQIRFDTPLQPSRAARLSQLSRLATENPELINQLEPDILQAASRGLTRASPELREALGTTAPHLRFMGMKIPGSETLAKPVFGGIGAAKAGVRKIPGVEQITRGPKGSEAAIRSLTRGSGEMSTQKALTQLALMDAMRLSGGSMLGRGNNMLRQLVRDEFKGMDRPAIEQMVRQTELPGVRTPINDFLENVATTYHKVTGQDLSPYLSDPDTYFPHMLRPAAKRFFREQRKGKDKVVADLMEKTGMFTDDLLEGSGYVEKSRKLTPNADGTPRTIKIGDRQLTIAEGTADELNRELKKLFPAFKDDFYETDPAKVLEAYVGSLSRQAGSRGALNKVADTANPLVQRVEGDLDAALQAQNEALARQQPLVDYMRAEQPDINFVGPTTPENPAPAVSGYQPGQTIPDLPLAPAAPTQVGDVTLADYFSTTKAQGATAEQERFLRNEGKKWLGEARKDVRDTRSRVATTLYDTRKNMMDGLRASEKVDSDAIKVLDKRIDAYTTRLNEIRPVRATTHDELTTTIVALDKDIADLEAEIAKGQRLLKSRTTKAQNEVDRKLESSLKTLRRLKEKADRQLNDMPADLRTAGKAKVEELLRPVERARAAVKAAEDAVPGRPSNDQLNWARGVLGTQDDAALAAKRADYEAAIDSVETLRRSGRTGKMTKATKQAIDEAEQEIARLRLELGRREAGATAYDTAQTELADARRTLDGLAKGSDERKAQQAVVAKLQRQFQKGGKFGDVKRAHEVLNQEAVWRKQADFASREQRKALSMAQSIVDNDPAMVRARAQAEASRYPVLQGRARRAGERVEEGEAALARSKDPTIIRRGPQGQPVKRRGFNEQRDVTIPAEEAARPTIRRGDQDLTIDQVADELNVTKGNRTQTIETERGRLRAWDDETDDLQKKLLVDTRTKKPLVLKRDQARELRARLNATRRNLAFKRGTRVKTESLEKALDEIESVAKANPLLDDVNLTATESLLQTQREALERVADVDITAKQANSLVKKAYDGKLAPVMLTALNDNWHMLHDGVLKTGDVIVDAELHTRFQHLYELNKEPTLFGRAFNTFTNLFKTYATLTPGFHVRNALGAVFMNTSDGVPLRMQIEGARMWSRYMKEGEAFLDNAPREIQEAFVATFGSGAGGRFGEVGLYGNEGGGFVDKMMANKVTRFSQRQGERVEGGVRLGMALHSIRRGDTAEEALQRITRIHFDYTQLSRLDEQMKRAIPFWTFMSRNLPMQVTQMWTKPQAYMVYQDFTRNFGSPDEPYTPDYWLRSGATNTGLEVPDLPLGGAQGLPVYMAPDLGFNRIEGDIDMLSKALGGDAGALASQFNPGLTAPAEYFTRQDFFTGQRFEEGEDFEELGGLNKLLYPFMKAAGQTNEAGQVDPRAMNVLRSVNPLMDRTSRLAPQLMGGDAEDRSRQLESWARFIGVPMRTLTPGQQESELRRRYFDQLKKMEQAQAMAQANAS